MGKCLKFAELSDANKRIVKEQLEKHVDNVNYDDVVVSPQDDDGTLIIEYGDIKIAVPIKKPSQETADSIWQTLTTGILIIAAVGVTLICSKKKSW